MLVEKIILTWMFAVCIAALVAKMCRHTKAGKATEAVICLVTVVPPVCAVFSSVVSLFVRIWA